jgi:hypothetical protein
MPELVLQLLDAQALNDLVLRNRNTGLVTCALLERHAVGHDVGQRAG